MHFIVKPSYISIFHLFKIHTRVDDELVSDNQILSPVPFGSIQK